MAANAVLGGFAFEDNEVTLVSMQRQSSYSPRGKRLQKTISLACEGEIIASTSDLIIARIQSIENALRDDNKEFRFSVNGTLAHSLLQSADCVSGIRVVQSSFPKSQDGELATVRTFSFTLQATYDAADDDLVSWQETIEQIGDGGPRFYVLETATNPVGVITTNASVITYQQSGRAVGYTNYPEPPPPCNPAGEMHASRRIGRISGRNMGGGAVRFFTRTWFYLMYRDPTLGGQSDFIPTSK